jgi:hypothetical protein
MITEIILFQQIITKENFSEGIGWKLPWLFSDINNRGNYVSD